MRKTRQWMTTIFACTLGLTLALQAQQPKSPTQTDHPDFAAQGEYTGQVARDGAGQKLGVQVIALGEGKFRAVFYPGGLPGDGWKKESKKEQAEGTDAFKSASYAATLKDGKMLIADSGGRQLGTLDKVTRKSPTAGKKPPQGAIVLFDGTSGDAWNPGRTQGGLLCEGQNSKQSFGSGTLHIEFILPFEPKGRGQGRGNSGCYLQSRYEVQILDSFGLEGKHNEAGGIYSVSDPAVNMCFPPLSWQTYDIEFTAPVFDANGKKTSNARMTVRHNGVVVQDNVEVPNKTTAAPLSEGPNPGPIHLQNHGHPVRFRNIWFVPKD